MRKVQTTDVSQISTANTSSRYPIGMLSLSSPTLDTRHRNMKGDQLVEKIVLEEDALQLDELVVVVRRPEKERTDRFNLLTQGQRQKAFGNNQLGPDDAR